MIAKSCTKDRALKACVRKKLTLDARLEACMVGSRFEVRLDNS